MIDFRIPFIGGALLGAVSLAAAQFIRIPAEVDETPTVALLTAVEME
jgi:hypothetical protein